MRCLEKLEYRGYDSAGISVVENGRLKTIKKLGKLSNLVNYINDNPLKGNVGIGHTRWANHGIPSEINAHPHTNKKGNISVVHNGIIENLKVKLISEGYEFKSETDTEVIAHLVDKYYEGNFIHSFGVISCRRIKTWYDCID